MPTGYESGAGRWDVTVYATGYQDYTFTIEAAPTEYVYGTMDIPYADYYYGELGNKTNTTDGTISYTSDLAGDAGMRAENTYDAVTSATAKNGQSRQALILPKQMKTAAVRFWSVKGVEVAIERICITVCWQTKKAVRLPVHWAACLIPLL